MSNKRARVSTDAVMATGNMDDGSEQWEGRLIPGLVENRVYGFPKSIITKIRYCDIQTIGSNATPTIQNYRANSVFDPDQTGIGHQPMHFDTYATIYNRYRVLGSKITAIWTTDRTSVDPGPPVADVLGGPWIVGINGTTGTASYSSTLTTRMEASESTYRVLSSRTGEDSVVVTTMSYSPDRQLGKPSGDDTVSAGVTGNPSQAWNFQLWLADITANATSVDIIVTVEIEYTVEFFELINAVAS